MAGLLRRLETPDAAGEGLRQAGADSGRGRWIRIPPSSRPEATPTRTPPWRLPRHPRTRHSSEHGRRAGAGLPAASQPRRRPTRILGMDISGWATGGTCCIRGHGAAAARRRHGLRPSSRPSASPPTRPAPPRPSVDDPLDRDSAILPAPRGENRWWDVGDSASIGSRSFNRYAEWLRLWNIQARGAGCCGRYRWQFESPRRLQRRRPHEGLQRQSPRVLLPDRAARLARVRPERRHRRCSRRRGAAGMSNYTNERVHRRAAVHEEPRRRHPEGGRRLADHRQLDRHRRHHRHGRLDGDGWLHGAGGHRNRRDHLDRQRRSTTSRRGTQSLDRLAARRSPASSSSTAQALRGHARAGRRRSAARRATRHCRRRRRPRPRPARS